MGVETTALLRLRHVSPRVVASLFLDDRSGENEIQALQFDEARKTLSVRGRPEAIVRLRELARLLDVPPAVRVLEVCRTRYQPDRRRRREVLSRVRLRARLNEEQEILLVADGARCLLRLKLQPQGPNRLGVASKFMEIREKPAERPIKFVRGISGVRSVTPRKLFPLHVLDHQADPSVADATHTLWWQRGGEPPPGESLELIEIVVG